MLTDPTPTAGETATSQSGGFYPPFTKDRKQIAKSSPAEPVNPDPNRAGLLCLERARSG